MIDIISSSAVSQNPFPRKLSCELKARRSNQRRDWRPAKAFLNAAQESEPSILPMKKGERSEEMEYLPPTVVIRVRFPAQLNSYLKFHRAILSSVKTLRKHFFY